MPAAAGKWRHPSGAAVLRTGASRRRSLRRSAGFLCAQPAFHTGGHTGGSYPDGPAGAATGGVSATAPSLPAGGDSRQRCCLPRKHGGEFRAGAPIGLHRTSLHAVRMSPLSAPNFLNESIAYSLHVGTNRQLMGRSGEISPAGGGGRDAVPRVKAGAARRAGLGRRGSERPSRPATAGPHVCRSGGGRGRGRRARSPRPAALLGPAPRHRLRPGGGAHGVARRRRSSLRDSGFQNETSGSPGRRLTFRSGGRLRPCCLLLLRARLGVCAVVRAVSASAQRERASAAACVSFCGCVRHRA